LEHVQFGSRYIHLDHVQSDRKYIQLKHLESKQEELSKISTSLRQSVILSPTQLISCGFDEIGITSEFFFRKQMMMLESNKKSHA
jgi:hypothetical protein